MIWSCELRITIEGESNCCVDDPEQLDKQNQREPTELVPREKKRTGMNKEFERKDPLCRDGSGWTTRVERRWEPEKDEFQNLIDNWNGSYSKCRKVPDPGPTLPSIILSSPSLGRLYYCIQLCIIAVSHLSLCSVCTLCILGEREKQFPGFPHRPFVPGSKKNRPPQNVV